MCVVKHETTTTLTLALNTSKIQTAEVSIDRTLHAHIFAHKNTLLDPPNSWSMLQSDILDSDIPVQGSKMCA